MNVLLLACCICVRVVSVCVSLFGREFVYVCACL